MPDLKVGPTYGPCLPCLARQPCLPYPDHMKPRFFGSASEFRAWLRDHPDAGELIVGFHKKATGQKTLTYPEALDQALCFGWIDGVRRRLDDESYSIRFSPRQPRSIWSRVNLRHVARLKAAGLMDQRGLDVLERRADGGEVTEEEWRLTRARCGKAFDDSETESDYKDNECLIEAVFRAVSGEYVCAVYQAANAAAWEAIPVYMLAGNEHAWDRALEREEAAQCQVLREVVGNPLRPVAVDPSWLTPSVLGLALGIYQDGAFDRMPILGDALEEAGCADEAILGHCRTGGGDEEPHVRGCWVVDMMLGKR